jgi:cytoskeletal protein RodZ
MSSRHKHGVIAAAAAGILFVGAATAQAPSAAPPATPNPTSAAPVQQTPLPATGTTPAPLQSPGVTSPLQNPGATTPSASSAQTPSGTSAGTTTMQNPNLAASPIQMPTVIPSKAETASSAFEKLATSGSTFATKEQADRLDGFDRAFSDADRDKDGKLSRDEFNAAWAIYTGRT